MTTSAIRHVPPHGSGTRLSNSDMTVHAGVAISWPFTSAGEARPLSVRDSSLTLCTKYPRLGAVPRNTLVHGFAQRLSPHRRRRFGHAAGPSARGWRAAADVRLFWPPDGRSHPVEVPFGSSGPAAGNGCSAPVRTASGSRSRGRNIRGRRWRGRGRTGVDGAGPPGLAQRSLGPSRPLWPPPAPRSTKAIPTAMTAPMTGPSR